MALNKDELIENLATDLSAKRNWRPIWRLVAWFGLAGLFSSVFMLSLQPFRPNFIDQLIRYPRFSLEIISATSLIAGLSYWFIISLVPGLKPNRILKLSVIAGGLLFIFSLVAGFHWPSPVASDLGSRPHCLEEVFFYGALSLFSILFYLKSSDYHPSPSHFYLIGLGAGLIPATLMQLACMYDPQHGLYFHYAPVIFLGFLGLVLPAISAKLSK